MIERLTGASLAPDFDRAVARLLDDDEVDELVAQAAQDAPSADTDDEEEDEQ